MGVTSVVNRISGPTIVVQYGGHVLEPAPIVDFTVDPIFDNEGTRTANKTRLVLDGTVLILPSGSYEQMFAKQTDLKNSFANDNLDFVISAGSENLTMAEGTIIFSGLTPKVVSLNIEPDLQYTRFDYTVELEDFTAVSGVSGVVSNYTNQWSLTEDPDSCTLQVTHTVSAQGMDGEAGAFEEAMIKVRGELGIAKLPLQLPQFTQPNASGGFNFTHPSNPAGGPIFEVSTQREETADVAAGTYSATEVFTIVSGVPFFYTQRTASYEEDANGIATVSLQGEIQGLGRTITPGFGLEGGLGFDRAVSGFRQHVKPQLPFDASGVYLKYKTNQGSGLHITEPVTQSISENACRGTVSFNFSYTDNPQAFLPSGIAVRTCSVNRTDGMHVYVYHPIPLRRLGPLRQDTNTTSTGQIVIQCNVTAKNTGNTTTDTNRAILYVQDELNRLRQQHASAGSFVTLTPTNKQQNFSDRELSCTATVTYQFTADISDTLGASEDIVLTTV